MGSDVGIDRASDVDAIVGAGMWQVHLGRGGGKLMSKAELEAAVANDEIGLETLVREPGAFSWTTAGAATGRSAAPTTPPEPERDISSANAIPLSTDDSDVDLASGDLPETDERAALPSGAPFVKDVMDVSRGEEPALTKEEARVTRPQPLNRSLAILAGLAFIGGVVVVAAPSRAQKTTTTAKPTTVATTTAVTTAVTTAATTVAAIPPPPPAAPPAPTTPVAKPPGEGPIVMIAVPPETGPDAAPPKPLASKSAPVATPVVKAQTPKPPPPAKTASKKPAPSQKKTASLPSVKSAPKAQSKAVAVKAHAQPARPASRPVTPPKAAPAKAAPAKPAAAPAKKPAPPPAKR